MNAKALALAKESKNALAARVKEARAARKTSYAALSQKIGQAQSTLTTLSNKAKQVELGFKAGSLKGQFNDLAAQGKIEKKELNALSFKDLAALPEAALKIVLKAYDDRTPSTDIITYGQRGAAVKAEIANLSKEDMVKAIQAQKKGVTSLSAEMTEKKEALTEGDVPAEEQVTPGVDKEMADQVVADVKDLIEQMNAVVSEYSSATEDMQKMSDAEEAEEKKEVLAAEEDEKKEALAAEDDKKKDDDKEKK